MKTVSRVISFMGVLLVLGATLSCGGSQDSERFPVFPGNDEPSRFGTWFMDPVTIFGTDPPAADVDTAGVVWGNLSAFPGDPVEFDDGTSWVVAVAIEEDDEERPPSYPVLRFLANDGETMSEVFEVPVYPVRVPGPPYYEEWYCRIPRVDCTYFDGMCWVVVVYRYACDTYGWEHIESHWDIRVTYMKFVYVPSMGWVEMEVLAHQLPDLAMQYPFTGQTHPEIAYDQASGDVYVAWTNLTENRSELYYKRWDWSTWHPQGSSAYSLKLEDRAHDPWYVSVDIGRVQWGVEGDDIRIVGFAYTGHFPEEDEEYWGFRPVVGYWSIDLGPDDDDHPAEVILVNEDFSPGDEGRKYHAGLARVDIPADTVDTHGAALVFIQDTEEGNQTGQYEVYGVSSLAPTEFTWISEPGEPPEFEHATLPSVAVHNTDGDVASVTYFAKEEDGEWEVWATRWEIDEEGLAVLGPHIEVDDSALGEFEMDANDFLYHDWGTVSSLVMIGTYDQYWAAWSDKMEAAQPEGVKGAMGYTDAS